MRLDPFQLERYFGQYEFSVAFPLAASDCDGLSLTELLALADAPTRDLWETLQLGYTETQGHPLLRREIAGLYMGCDPDQVLVAAPEELIFIAMNCLVRNGDHVVCTFPGYQSLYSRGRVAARRGQPLGARRGRRLALRPRAPRRAHPAEHPPDRRELPSQPDGRAAELRRLRAHPRDRGELRHRRPLRRDVPAARARRRRPAAGGGRALRQGGVAVGRLQDHRSGRPAHRLARGARRTPHAAPRSQLKDYTTICSSAPSEILAMAGLRARDAILARHHERIERNLGLLDGFMAKYEALFSWVPPRGRHDLLSALQARLARHLGALPPGASRRPA